MPPGNCPSPGTALTGVKQKHASVLVLVGSRTEGRSNAQPRVLRTRSTLLPTPYLGAASDPQVKVSGQRECLPVPLIPVATSGCPLCFWPTGCKSEAVNDTFLGSIILLEQLTELRGTCYFLDYWFTTKVMKDLNQQLDEQMDKARSWTQELLSWGFGNLEALGNPILLGFYGGFTTYAGWKKSLMAMDSNSSISPFPGGWWRG